MLSNLRRYPPASPTSEVVDFNATGDTLTELAIRRHFQADPAYHNQDPQVQSNIVDAVKQWKKLGGERMSKIDIADDVGEQSSVAEYSYKG